MSPAATVDPFVKVAKEAEWAPPRGGFQRKPNEFEAIVQKAADTGRAYTLTFDLEAEKEADRIKEISATIRRMRAAGDRVKDADGKDSPKSVAAYAGEIDKATGRVDITFKVMDKITRSRPDSENGEQSEGQNAA